MNIKEYKELINNEKESGFFHLPKHEVCTDKDHSPPMYIHIPEGWAYRHICPSCGHMKIIKRSLSYQKTY